MQHRRFAEGASLARAALVRVAVLLIVGATGCSGSSGILFDGLPITGDYDLAIDTTLDGCGFGGGSVTTPMQVDEIGSSTAEVALPVGSTSECNRQVFVRAGDTLTLSASSQVQIGSCPALLDVTTVLDFFADETVSGTETNELTILDAEACAGLDDCTIELSIAGARCQGCFACMEPAGAPAAGPWGLLAVATGIQPAALEPE